MARRRKATNKRSIDFSNATRYFEPDERVLLTVKAAEWGESPTDREDEAPLFATFTGNGDNSDREVVHRVAMTSKALGYAREFFEALGYDIEDGEAVDIDTDELVGRQCWAETYERKYTNDEGEERTTTALRAFEPAEDGDEEERPSKGKKGKKGKKKESISREAVEAMDREELEELIEEHDLEVDPSEKKLKRPAKLKKAIIDAMEEADLLEDEEEEEEEEEEEKPKKGKRGQSSRGSKGSKKKSTNWSSEDIEEMSEEELDEIVEQAGIDLDLSEFKTLRKKRNQLIDALEAEDMLSE